MLISTPKAFGGRMFSVGSSESCLGRAGDDEWSAQITEDYIELCNSATTFHEFAECNEQG
jgi:hypothetical protein